MLKKVVILALLALQSSMLFGDDPVMLIRCRALAGFDANAILMCPTGFEPYQGQCYPLSVDGVCPEVPPFTSLVQEEVITDLGDTVIICVPDCSSVCTGCYMGESEWSASLQACICSTVGLLTEAPPEDQGLSGCGCPEPLIVNPSYSPSETESIVNNTGYCILPEKNCYNLGLSYTVQPFACDAPSMTASDTITIVIKAGPGQPALTPNDAITLEDLENCNLTDGSEGLIALAGTYGPDDRPAFIPDASGCVTITFTRTNPSAETRIKFLGDQNQDIVVPGCARSFDPCSCRPENITDADGTVLFWYDEWTLVGTPNTPVTLTANNIPAGFLDNTQTPVAVNTVLGMTDGTGVLSVPFFRTPGQDTDVAATIGAASTGLRSSCNLAVNACSNIVPTLGEWSLIVLSLLLLIFGIVSFSSNRGRLQPIKERVKK